MTPFETIEYKGCTIKLFTDEDASSPREDDNVGEILYTSTRYTLGDRQTSSEEIREITERTDVVYLPVYAYIHSGTRLNCSGFSCPWDSGQCGIIWCTKERAIKEWGNTRFTKKVREKAEQYLRGEIATLDSYFSGDVFGYVAEGPEDEQIGSCWGFYPEDTNEYFERYQYAINEAKMEIDTFVKDREQQTEQHLALT